MKIEYAFLSDYAQERGGSLGAMGVGIDTLITPEFPVTHPHLFLVVQLRCGKNERKVHDLSLRLVDPQGEALVNQEGQVDFSQVPAGQEGLTRLVFGFYLVPFKSAGRHSFEISVGKEVLQRVPLYLIQQNEAPPESPSDVHQLSCDFAFLADYAAERGGTISAYGIGVDNMMAPQLPATHPHLFMVLQLRCPVSELGTKSLRIQLLNEKGQAMMEQTGHAQFEKPPLGDNSVARLVLGFHMLTFQNGGVCTFAVEMDGRTMARLPFQVASSAPPAPTMKAPKLQHSPRYR